MRAFAPVLLAILFVAVIAAAPDEKMKSDRNIEGRVLKISLASKKMEVQDKSDTEYIVYWDDSTSVSGGMLKVGSNIRCRISEKEADGKWWALTVRVLEDGKGK